MSYYICNVAPFGFNSFGHNLTEKDVTFLLTITFIVSPQAYSIELGIMKNIKTMTIVLCCYI